MLGPAAPRGGRPSRRRCRRYPGHLSDQLHRRPWLDRVSQCARHETRRGGVGPRRRVEIDGYDTVDTTAWSVVVKGAGRRIESMKEYIEADELPLFPWHTAPKPDIVRINRRSSPADGSTPSPAAERAERLKRRRVGVTKSDGAVFQARNIPSTPTDIPECQDRGVVERNWAGNVEYRAATVDRPATVDELREMVVRSTQSTCWEPGTRSTRSPTPNG